LIIADVVTYLYCRGFDKHLDCESSQTHCIRRGINGKDFSCFQRTYCLSIKQKQQGNAANGGPRQHREHRSAQSQTPS